MPCLYVSHIAYTHKHVYTETHTYTHSQQQLVETCINTTLIPCLFASFLHVLPTHTHFLKQAYTHIHSLTHLYTNAKRTLTSWSVCCFFSRFWDTVCVFQWKCSRVTRVVSLRARCRRSRSRWHLHSPKSRSAFISMRGGSSVRKKEKRVVIWSPLKDCSMNWIR